MEFFTNNLTTLIGGGTSAIVLWILRKLMQIYMTKIKRSYSNDRL